MSETDRARSVLEVVHRTALELHPERGRDLVVRLDSRLDRDLGFDSLGRMELVSRLEAIFEVQLPESALASAETPRHLLEALDRSGGRQPDRSPATAPPLGPVDGVPRQAETLVDVLSWHAERHPDRLHVDLLGDAGISEPLTYADLLRRGRSAAQGLRALGVSPGDRVALMLPTCLDYFVGFVGALLATATPVPLYPPARPSQIEDHLRRQSAILDNSQARVLVTSAEVQPVARLLRARVPSLERVVTVGELELSAPDAPLPAASPRDLAFLQYTSGSTGRPKGVVLTHENLVESLRAMGGALDVTSGDRMVSWLPLYHDMGLIGAWMGSLFYAFPLALMSPLAFLSRPARWLEAMTERRGTIAAAPNFAYELCVKRVTDDEIARLDLSSWRAALNGAEPVSPLAVERFAARFAAAGFRPEAMLPVYGLAECSLGVAFPPPLRGPRFDRVDREAFAQLGQARPTDGDDPSALVFVSCGSPIPRHEVRIVDPSGRELPERLQGRLEFRGPAATTGYYRHPDATAELFDGDWLDSGDLAYVAEGEIYLTGRAKDLVIKAGRNIHPQELEEAVGEVEGIRKGCVAVFGGTDESDGTERLVVLAESRVREPAARDALRQAVIERAVDAVGVPPDEVLLAAPGTVLKTSSGKIRRSSCRQLYEAGRLGRPSAVWWQLLLLALGAVGPQLGRARVRVGEWLFGTRAWLVFALLAVPAWLSVALLPGLRTRRRATRGAARLLGRLSGLPIRVVGDVHLPDGPCVVVANHQSYVDGFVLSAALPPRFGFAVKGELRHNALTRLPLERLGAIFVERFAAEGGVGDAQRTAEALRAGSALVFFPEGTFTRAPGLLPFRLGAFAAAGRSGVPVVPAVVRGTRSVLRGSRWLPHRAPIEVELLSPHHPTGHDWSATVRLRDEVRDAMLARCGEPDLAAAGLETVLDQPVGP